jgi:hypothetical protein
MFSKYNLSLHNSNEINSNNDLNHSLSKLSGLVEKLSIHNSLKSLVSDPKIINGSELQNDWFPEVSCEVFISHSRADKELAETLAHYLYANFSLSSFIDSWVWQESDSLLSALDEKYNVLIENDRLYGKLYDHSKCKETCSHVNMILNTALHKMIDKTECLIFLNTPNSVPAFNPGEQTYSPWIYSELEFARMVRRTNHDRPKKAMHIEKLAANERTEPPILHDLDLSTFTKLTSDSLKKWKNSWRDNNISSSLHALDCLYELYPPS